MTSQRPLEILAIEDDDAVREALSSLLESCGVYVDAAEGGQRGVDMFNARAQEGRFYDAVVTDFAMPKMDGLEVIRAIRALRPQTPVYLISALNELVRGSTDTEPDGYVPKPFRIDDLKKLIAGIKLAERSTLSDPYSQGQSYQS